MRIGILTQTLKNNYGGLLQNYALQTVLFRMGHNPVTIDWNASNSLKERVWRLKQRLLVFLKCPGKKAPRYFLTNREDAIVSKYTNRFINSHILRTDTLKTENEFAQIARKYNFEAYVVGSDQVWRPRYNVFLNAMFLDFTKQKNVKRVAYAASFGTTDWEFNDEQTKKCSALAKKFDYISVREKSGVDLCNKYLGVRSVQVLDPTLLLYQNDYIDLIEKTNVVESEGDLFYYLLDNKEEQIELVNEIAKRNKLNPFTVMPNYSGIRRTRNVVKSNIDDCVFPSVESWLRAFQDAKMIVTDSFHGTVFSIIFNKPFWVFGNMSRGNARFETLLGVFQLEDRLINISNIEDVDWYLPINWDNVNKIWEEERVRCTDYLKNAFKD